MAEIRDAVSEAGIDVPFVPVVPVRMTEAWLLFDEHAIRRAAGNPRGSEQLSISPSGFEDIADSKQVLHTALRLASGLPPRRRAKFKTAEASHRVADYISDFSPLRALPAFKTLEESIIAVIQRCGWS